ncbi:MAG: type II toxin-antitoxin system VapC family toxin [Burkholderiales bacterium]|nr:type II toxin-antitoxin system VapC family toxin [Burkholderiales bacterium]
MILLDANLLIYAVDADSPHHARARRWLEETLSGDTRVGLPWAVILAFLRITTRSGILRRPLPPDDAIAYVESWLGQPYVEAVAPGENHWPVLRSLLRSSGTAGNLTADAHLAAVALEHGCTIATADNDFRRFAGVACINPVGD